MLHPSLQLTKHQPANPLTIPSHHSNTDDAVQLRRQYNELSLQLSTPSLTTTSPNLQTPNNPSLTPDFASARTTKPASSLRRPDSSSATTGPNPKNVRFRDASPTTTAARAALLPYQDDPDTDTPPDHSALDNQQIHAYHSRVMAEQDRALDVLGASVGRQRELSIQIGDELDEQVQMLGDTEERVDRYQTRLDGARDRLGRVARRAKDNMQLTVIFILIIVLVLLIVILK